jgi:hypothetical protein
MPQVSTQADQLIKKLNLPAVTGTVKIVRGKYYFVDRKTKLLLPSSFVGEDKLTNMVNHKITAVMAGKESKDILALFPYEDTDSNWKIRCFMCYVPNPNLWKRIDGEVQQNLINSFQKTNVINEEQAAALKEFIAR